MMSIRLFEMKKKSFLCHIIGLLLALCAWKKLVPILIGEVRWTIFLNQSSHDQNRYIVHFQSYICPCNQIKLGPRLDTSWPTLLMNFTVSNRPLPTIFDSSNLTIRIRPTFHPHLPWNWHNRYHPGGFPRVSHIEQI